MNRTLLALSSSVVAALGTKGVFILSGITGRSPECLRAIESAVELTIQHYCSGLTDAGLWMIFMVAVVIGAVTFVVTKPQEVLDVVGWADNIRGEISSKN